MEGRSGGDRQREEKGTEESWHQGGTQSGLLPLAWAGSCLRPSTGPPQGPATATIQVKPSNPGEGWEEDPRIAGLKIEEEQQPTGEPVQEPGREETSGSTSKTLEGSCWG